MIGTSIMHTAVGGPQAPSCTAAARAGCRLWFQGPTDGKTVAQSEVRSGSDPTEQAQGALGLAKVGLVAAPAVPTLVEAPRSPDQLVKQNAALCSATLDQNSRSAVPALMTALADSAWQIRAAAVSLGNIGPDAKPAEKCSSD